MRRLFLALLSLALMAPLLLLAEPASAATTKTASCTDGGGHRWKVKAVWGGVYSSGGTRRVSAKAVKLTTKRAVRYVDYTIRVVDGKGSTVKKVRREDRRFNFAKGTRYLSVNPKNPPSAPGRTKIVVTVGDGKDGKPGCRVSFAQPGRSSGSSGGSGGSGGSGASGSTCTPGREVVKFKGQGSDDLAQYGQGSYNASAELWNVGGYRYAQTMGVCTHDSWYVDVKADNAKRDGAVKAYPSMRKIYHDWGRGGDFSRDPLVSSFKRLDVTFAATDPKSCSGCIYDTAFDIWLNGIGNGSANEVMIWTRNVGQRPYGSKVASGVKIAGHTWNLWSGNGNHYLAFEPTDTSKIAAGTFDITDFTDYLVSRKKISSRSRMGQVSYGVETVSTNGATKRWNFTRFSVKDS